MSLSCSRRRLLLAGVGLTALSTLLVELALTRLFSVATGRSSCFAPGWRVWPPPTLPLAVIYFASAVPFFFSRVVLSVVLARTVDRAMGTLLLKRSFHDRATGAWLQRGQQGSPERLRQRTHDRALSSRPAAGHAFRPVVRAADPSAYIRDYPFAISPADDKRPFFFFTVKTRDLLSLWRSRPNMVLPARLTARLPRTPGVRRWLLYFVALAVAVFWLLAACGAGNYGSRRLPE